MTEKCECIFLGSRTVSLSRSSGETLAVHSTESIFCKKMRGEKTALKSCSSLLALLSFPKLLPPLRFPQRLSFHYRANFKSIGSLVLITWFFVRQNRFGALIQTFSQKTAKNQISGRFPPLPSTRYVLDILLFTSA